MAHAGAFTSRWKGLKEKLAAKHKEQATDRKTKGAQKAFKKGGMAGFGKYAAKVGKKEARKEERKERFRKGVEKMRDNAKRMKARSARKRTGPGLVPKKDEKGKAETR